MLVFFAEIKRLLICGLIYLSVYFYFFLSTEMMNGCAVHIMLYIQEKSMRAVILYVFVF